MAVPGGNNGFDVKEPKIYCPLSLSLFTVSLAALKRENPPVSRNVQVCKALNKNSVEESLVESGDELFTRPTSWSQI